MLCSKLEPLPSQQAIDMKNNDGEIQIQDYQTYNEEDIAECERINIKDTSNYRFYIKKETGFLIKINCGLQIHFFIGKIIR